MGQWYEKGNVTRIENTISILKCKHPNHAYEFLSVLKKVIGAGYKDIKINIEADTIYPNACVPIRGMIDHYSKEGISFQYSLNSNTYLSICGFVEPYRRTKEELKEEIQPFDKIYYYENPGQVAYITQAYKNAISREYVCGKGILRGLDWCINEVMDNVLLHSETDHGFVMAQYHSTNNKVVICVYDDGIGIYNSLQKSQHKPQTEIDAIYLSLQEGVGDGQGQGNGLFGLYQIIQENHGSLSITSGKTSLIFGRDGETKKLDRIPIISNKSKGTIIDFQLDLQKDIDLQKAFQSIGGLDDFDARIDEMLDDNDFVVYNVFENSQGTGTRISGAALRNDVENILKRDNNGIILDFKDVQMVSSSFIDEFIAKLVLDIGFINFNSLIRLRNMEKEIRFLCERSFYMRIHDTWAGNSRSEQTKKKELYGKWVVDS